MLNIIIIIIVLLLTYFFLFKSQKESFQVPRDFYELDNLNDSQFTKINENLQEYPNSITEIVNIVKNKKIIAAYERRATPDSEESEKRLDYNMRGPILTQEQLLIRKASQQDSSSVRRYMKKVNEL